ncbi:hypothetical protein EKO04_003454 [Ascochyta lentis]|uniref:Uncharacterized protein n=1 Tax=Ascochyta lentis TaxID=205686 RepID=A0A8H7J5K5_9PLEO|nr:hypothetical protein EKO04_003454 [Ascochyta lentis]
MTASPNLTFTPPPFRLTRHNPRYTLDTILETAFSTTTPSRPSTASTTSSFATAFSSMEAGSPFRYYLPQISTPTSPVFTTVEDYACNLTQRVPDEQSERVERFCYYVPGKSTEERDVYVDDGVIGMVEPVVEQKALGGLKQVVFDEVVTAGEIGGPLQNTAGACCPGDEGGVVDISSYAAGEKLDTRASTLKAGDGKTEKKQRAKLKKDQYRKSETVGNVSKKVKKMLKKLHLGRKAS